jgi:hypothetical protein
MKIGWFSLSDEKKYIDEGGFSGAWHADYNQTDGVFIVLIMWGFLLHQLKFLRLINWLGWIIKGKSPKKPNFEMAINWIDKNIWKRESNKYKMKNKWWVYDTKNVICGLIINYTLSFVFIFYI